MSYLGEARRRRSRRSTVRALVGLVLILAVAATGTWLSGLLLLPAIGLVAPGLHVWLGVVSISAVGTEIINALNEL